MKREATVVREGDRLVAEIVRTDACGQCHACEFGRKEKLHYPLPAGEYAEGDVIQLEVSDRAVSRASLLAYGLPLACLVAGLLLGWQLFNEEWAQALCAIALLAAGCAYLAVTEKRRRASGAFACRAHKPGRTQSEE